MNFFVKSLLSPLILTTFLMICAGCQNQSEHISDKEGNTTFLILQAEDKIIVLSDGDSSTILVQEVGDNFRPYLHPIKAPGSEVNLTQFSPDHHKHQTGLFWE